jgi:hypothetical protein
VRFYNIWHGRGVAEATSGTIVDELAERWRRYACDDIGFDADFKKLVFQMLIVLALLP